jgi:hypothetical protein
MGIFGGVPKQDVAGEQARLKASQDAAARAELDKQAQARASSENTNTAKMQQEQGARQAFMQGVVQDTDESRRKFLKKV